MSTSVFEDPAELLQETPEERSLLVSQDSPELPQETPEERSLLVSQDSPELPQQRNEWKCLNRVSPTQKCCTGPDAECRKTSEECKEKPSKSEETPGQLLYIERATSNIYCGSCTTTKLCETLKKTAEDFEKSLKLDGAGTSSQHRAAAIQRTEQRLFHDLKTLDFLIILKYARHDKICDSLVEGKFTVTARKILSTAVAVKLDEDPSTKAHQKRKRTLARIKLYTLRILANAVAFQEIQEDKSKETITDEESTDKKKGKGKERKTDEESTDEKKGKSKERIVAALAGEEYPRLIITICKVPTEEGKQETEKEKARQLEAGLVLLFYMAKADERNADKPAQAGDGVGKTSSTQDASKVTHQPATAREPNREPVKKGEAKEQIPGPIELAEELLKEYKGTKPANIQALALLVLSRTAPEKLDTVIVPDGAIEKIVSWVLITHDVQVNWEGTSFSYGLLFRAEDLLSTLTIMATERERNKLLVWMAIEDYVDQLYSKKMEEERPVAHELLEVLIKNEFALERLKNKAKRIWTQMERCKQATDNDKSSNVEKEKIQQEAQTQKDQAKPKDKPKFDKKIVESAIKFKNIKVVEKTVIVPEDLVAVTTNGAGAAESGQKEPSESQKVLYELMEIAIEENNGEFVKHFIEKGIDLQGMMTHHKEKWGERQRKIEAELDKILPELNDMENRRHAMRTLLLHSLLENKQEIALVFWKYETEKMIAALFAKTLLRTRRMLGFRVDLAKRIKGWEQQTTFRELSKGYSMI